MIGIAPFARVGLDDWTQSFRRAQRPSCGRNRHQEQTCGVAGASGKCYSTISVPTPASVKISNKME